MRETFQKFPRDAFERFWKNVRSWGFLLRDLKWIVLGIFLLVLLGFLLWKWKSAPFWADDVLGAAFFGFMWWRFTRLTTKEERRMMHCPACDHRLHPKDVEWAVATSMCRKCGAEILI